MFDKYIVCEDSLRTTDAARRAGGVEIRMPYYRGLGLSMVEGIDLEIDGVRIPAERTTFTVRGSSYAMTDLPGVLDDRWEMGERAEVAFQTDQPLEPGPHRVTANVRLRVSYMPVPAGGRDTKTLLLA